MSEPEFTPELILAITTAFNDGLLNLFQSVHGIMPDNAIVLNAVSALCIARKKLGFTEQQTRDEIIKALNLNMKWSAAVENFGGEK